MIHRWGVPWTSVLNSYYGSVRVVRYGWRMYDILGRRFVRIPGCN